MIVNIDLILIIFIVKRQIIHAAKAELLLMYNHIVNVATILRIAS